MRAGDCAGAWAISDEILRERAGRGVDWRLPRHRQAIWNGTPLDGREILVRCYHGLGDTIQFIRFVPLLRARARRVIVWAQAPLLPLLRTVPGVDCLLPLHDGDVGVRYDADIESMELPFYFGTTIETIPATVPYLHVEDAPQLSHGPRPRVGLVWKAGDWAPERSLPDAAVADLLKAPVSWVVLQNDVASSSGLPAPASGSENIVGWRGSCRRWIWSSRSTRCPRTWPARSGCLFGRCFRRKLTGGG